MGVGLALSHATIERLDGEMWMRPAQGPAAASASACRWPHARTPHEPSSLPRACWSTTTSCTCAPCNAAWPAGLETQTAQDAASALALARQHPPAFALIDLKLGSDSGLALIQPLRADSASCW